MNATKRFVAVIAASTALLTSPALGRAQEVYGTLQQNNGSSAGLVVVAEQLASGGVVARTVVGSRGAYSLRLTTDRTVIRVLSVGKQPVVLDTIQLLPGERREISRTLSLVPLVLSALSTSSDSRCSTKANISPRLAVAFGEVRTALLLSQLVPSEGTTHTKYRVRTEERSLDYKSVLDSRDREGISDS